MRRCADSAGTDEALGLPHFASVQDRNDASAFNAVTIRTLSQFACQLGSQDLSRVNGRLHFSEHQHFLFDILCPAFETAAISDISCSR
jgi:hypothetical protein